MSILIYIFGSLSGIVLFGALVLIATGNSHIFRGIKVVYLKGKTTTYIDDWPQFDNRTIKAADPSYRDTQQWKEAEDYNSIPPTDRLQRTHDKMGTIAFLIIKDDEIWHENYAEGYGRSSKTNSFSVAKSFTVGLLGKAIEEGFIKDLDQPVADFFPGFDARVNVGHLANMTSGMEWTEEYDNPFSSVARIYLVKDVRKYMLAQKIVVEPGTVFDYNSGNTCLLGMVIEKATGQALSDYLSKHFWQPLGMQYDALWELDGKESKMEKAYCCIASNARDFARFGKLFSNKGMWNGERLISADFVEKCIHPSLAESPEYGYGFWLSSYKNKQIFVMRGILGQYVINIPEDNLIITRLGHKRGIFKNGDAFTEDFYVYVDEAYKMLELRNS